VHEFSIATSLVDTLLEFARRENNSRKMLEVHVKIGKLRGISIDQLVFSYKILVKGTILKETKLLVEEIPARVHCQKCGYQDDFQLADDSYHFGIPTLSCSQCNTSMSLEGGDEVLITKIRMQDRRTKT
jgi:hydrogenase nickel incorporation protein HypA/HybF